MAMQESQIKQEIRDEIEAAWAAGRPASESWLIETVMARRAPLSGKDAELHEFLARQGLTALVREVLHELEPPSLDELKHAGTPLQYERMGSDFLKHAERLRSSLRSV